MDIYQLKYYCTVIESNYNISTAAKKLHVSQPALTQVIKKFESDEKIELFYRYQGRLVGLTPLGEAFYLNACNVIAHHERMMKELREHSTKVRGKIRIGIPPLVLTVLFTQLLSQLVIQNPDIHFDIIEEGAFELQRLLKLQDIDFAVISQPTDLNNLHFKEEVIFVEEVSCFLSKSHPLAEKDTMDWVDLKDQNLAIFSNTFMIHHQLMRKFESLSIVPKIALMSTSWDFLLESTLNSDFITVLPGPVRNHIVKDMYKELPFTGSMPWKVVLTYPNKSHYSKIETYTRDSIYHFFQSHRPIVPIK